MVNEKRYPRFSGWVVGGCVFDWLFVQMLSLPFTLAFFLVRGIVMPIFLVDYNMFMFAEENPKIGPNNLLAIRVCVGIFTMGWFGSLVWLQGVVGGYIKYRRKVAAKAKEALASKAQ